MQSSPGPPRFQLLRCAHRYEGEFGVLVLRRISAGTGRGLHVGRGDVERGRRNVTHRDNVVIVLRIDRTGDDDREAREGDGKIDVITAKGGAPGTEPGAADR